MALTATEKALCREYLGWPFGFNDRDSHLEQSFSGLETKPEEEARVQALLVSLQDVDTKIAAAHGRLKANKVGSIELNRAELQQLYREGNRFLGRLSRLLGVPVRSGGGFSPGLPTASSERGGFYPTNYVGK